MQAVYGAAVMALLLVAGSARAAQEIPAPPADGSLIADHANLLSFVGKTTVEGSQKKALREHDTPIVVVTIRRMADYDVKAAGIEAFAKTWFDRWGIGTLNARGGGSNKGILLLVSERDRKARIKLGADWGHDWDYQARKIMDESIVPKFRAGNFDDGIDRGVAALAEMAASGPSGGAPSAGWRERVEGSPTVKKASALSALGPLPFSALLLVGLGLIGASFAVTTERRTLLLAGVGLLVAAAFTYVAIAVIGVIALRYAGQHGLLSNLGGSDHWGSSSRSSSSSGRSGGGGGGFGGGSSGGGGATGSW